MFKLSTVLLENRLSDTPHEELKTWVASMARHFEPAKETSKSGPNMINNLKFLHFCKS